MQRTYDLEERTAKFGEAILGLMKRIPDDIPNRVLKSQLVRSGTNVGANYMEADAASSKRDFVHKISICKKEARETQHWLRMMKVQNPTLEPDVAILQKEIQELVFIFSAIINSCRSSKSDDSPNP